MLEIEPRTIRLRYMWVQFAAKGISDLLPSLALHPHQLHPPSLHTPPTATMLRRSTRNEGKTVDYAALDSTSFFPDGEPTNEIEHIFQALNLKAFPCSSYARVDDILVCALFSTKHRPYSYRALQLEAAGDDTLAGLTDKDIMAISKIITSEIEH